MDYNNTIFVLKIVEAFLKIGITTNWMLFSAPDWVKNNLGGEDFIAQLHRWKLNSSGNWILLVWFHSNDVLCLLRARLLANFASRGSLFSLPCSTSQFSPKATFLGFFFGSFFNITSPISAPWKTALFWPPSFVYLFWVLFASAGWLAVLVRERIPYPKLSLFHH